MKQIKFFCGRWESDFKELKSDKASSGDIPTKILKQCDFSYEVLTCLNEYINNGHFPGST